MALKRPHSDDEDDEEIDVCGIKDPGTPDTIPMTDSTYEVPLPSPKPAKKPRKSKKMSEIDMTGLDASGQKVNYGLPENFAALNFRVIAEVGRRRCLYDEGHPDYKDSAVRNEAWIEIGLTLGMQATFVKTRWKTLRDRCAREERRARAEGRPNTWPFLNAIAFLLPHLKEKGHNSSSSEENTNGGEKYDRHRERDKVDVLREVAEQELPASPAFVAEETVIIDTEEVTQPFAEEPPKTSPKTPVQLSPPVVEEKKQVIEATPLSARWPPFPTALDTANIASALPYLDAASLELPNAPLMISSEDEIFGKIVALKLSRLDARIKELAKVRLLQVLYEVQFGGAAAAMIAAVTST